jgi:integrase
MNIDYQLQPFTVSIASDWQTEFSSHISRNYRNAKTAGLVHQHVRVFALWYQAKFNQAFEPSLLTNYDLHLFRAESLKSKKAATWNSRLWALEILCAWIGDPSLLEDIEAQGQGRVSTKHRSLTDDEYHRLIHALEQNPRRAVTQFEYSNAVRDWAAVSLMLHGLRVEETSLLNVDDITLNERSGDVLVRNGKGSKERSVPIHLIGRKALAAFLAIRPASASDNLFSVSVRTLQRNVEALGAQIGVPDLTCHWLRYTFAKRLERSGVAIETVRDLLGHNSIETTRRYLRSSAEELQSAVEGVM